MVNNSVSQYLKNQATQEKLVRDRNHTHQKGDFFYKKQIDYSKKQKAITEDDLF